MPYCWPEDTDFAWWELDVLDRDCPFCGRMMHICDHRYRHLHTLEGPIELVCRLNRCPDHNCPGHAKTISPEHEISIALPKWAIGWDVLCWLGQRRFSRHWSVPQIRTELLDRFRIAISEDSISRYLNQYQIMVAASREDAEVLRKLYAGTKKIILTIDGLQPEKGHETLYVVRELTQKRVWFAEPLLSATASEVQRLIAKAKAWADQLGVEAALWTSDRQDAFVTGIAAEFPGVPHRFCSNHFVRDVAKPLLEADSHAKVTMRKKVRGLRNIEQKVLKEQQAEQAANAVTTETPITPIASDVSANAVGNEPSTREGIEASASVKSAEVVGIPVASVVSPATIAVGGEASVLGGIVLEYCAAVRGILNDDQGGPLRPPGLRMAEALGEVRASIQRNLDLKKGVSHRSNSVA